MRKSKKTEAEVELFKAQQEAREVTERAVHLSELEKAVRHRHDEFIDDLEEAFRTRGHHG